MRLEGYVKEQSNPQYEKVTLTTSISFHYWTLKGLNECIPDCLSRKMTKWFVKQMATKAMQQCQVHMPIN